MKQNLYWLLCLFLVAVYTSCGDMLESRKQIIGKYYLVETDTKDNISISYKLKQGDYVGRIAPKVQEYAVIGDTLIAGKTLQAGYIQFYVIKIKNDSEYAEPTNYLVGPMTENEFTLTYAKASPIRF